VSGSISGPLRTRTLIESQKLSICRRGNALSTMPNQANLAAHSWKQEVNRRVAAHRTRKEVESGDPVEVLPQPSATNARAAQVLARVNARYAKAPSYNQALADEARAAARAAEEASRAAQHAHAAMESVLASLEEASIIEPEQLSMPHLVERQPQAAEATLPPASQAVPQPRFAELAEAAPPAAPAAREPLTDYAIRWEPDFPIHQQEPAAEALKANHGPLQTESSMEDWLTPQAVQEPMVEPAQPIHANLIEFPRELVAARKVRPRLVEGPMANQEPESAQLSIFEVDPEAVTQGFAAEQSVYEATMAPTEAAPAHTAPQWQAPQWQSMELDPRTEAEENLLPTEDPKRTVRTIQAAPLNWRMMATVVNFSLVLSITSAAVWFGRNLLPVFANMRAMEVAAAGAVATVGCLYALLFTLLGLDTPGAIYAHLRLCTLEGERPNATQRLIRLGAIMLSVLPLGLGLAWAIFDDDRLCSHDRLTKSYMRHY